MASDVKPKPNESWKSQTAFILSSVRLIDATSLNRCFRVTTLLLLSYRVLVEIRRLLVEEEEEESVLKSRGKTGGKDGVETLNF